MPDLPPELRDRAARAACDAWYADTPDHGWLAVVDVVAEVLAEHQTAECDCTGFPQPEGPYAWCDVHGQPSVAWSQGIENGVQQERVLSEMRLADLRVRAERAEAELAQVRRQIGEWAERLDTHDSHGDGAENADRRLLKVIEEMWGSARSVSPDPTAALSGPAGAAHTEETS